MTNPYSPPDAAFDSPLSATQEPTVFAIDGRIGRLRYLAYSLGGGLLLLALGALLGALQGGAGLMFWIYTILSLVVTFVLARRRLQDLDRGAWFGLLLFIPLVNVLAGLWLLFARGDEGANSYGLPPGPNSRGVMVLAWILPVIFVVGIMAAVAVPAYQGFLNGARAGAGQSF
ncbi:uncharacterized membrane protein YhaH (DUF805 family) [Pseudoduganella lurida]|uniref:Uncharacterized membrane protein YhaH (DUF805 family) n=1 Tax=Pseudoduganella lurida TaxID=1036180 RepID=A0A562QXI6_9BURK|nr:DUF805 domain-containing protein [Pseudoduganella lurida]TWI60920.1 uncharacterized membrane protein YhaH (DUF805 family) [Pseudoduganella lurida]